MPRSPIPEIVDAIADAKGTDPQRMDITLQEHIDADAIQNLADHETATWTLAFELPNHNVTVTSDGLVFVDGVRRHVWNRGPS
jgi:hypothetical protein